MAIVSGSLASAFDNLSPSTGFVSSTSSEGVALSFTPEGSKQGSTLKLYGSFDAQGRLGPLSSAVYVLPDASSVTLSFPGGSTVPELGSAGTTLRVDRLLESLLGGDDWFTLGDKADRTQAGSGNDYINAGGGDDVVQGGPGNDFIAGGAGLDRAVFAGPRSRYAVAVATNGYSIADQSGADGTDTVSSVERLQFNDLQVALDLDGHAGHAGQVARIIGAVFGAKAVANRDYVGIGLKLLDDGMSYTDLAALAVSVTGKSAPADVVKLLWGNVIGGVPSSADAQPFVDLLKGGMSIGQLAVLAADTDLNATNIDLTGLAKTGLEYHASP
ncbi:hypothetical protein [Aquabacterium sp.]|uniref:hypothetical protein n=1 Tax=Aquabacterium sp. TaxID=1872578 RepID=UPI003784C466